LEGNKGRVKLNVVKKEQKKGRNKKEEFYYRSEERHARLETV
jgi:hypothetical protein